jgi:hypothetical protein
MENLYNAATNDFLVVCAAAFPFVYISIFRSLAFAEGVNKGRKWIRKKWQPGKIQLQLRIRMMKNGLCVDVASLATSIMAFYSTGKIDSMIEQLSSLLLSHSRSHIIFTHIFRKGKKTFFAYENKKVKKIASVCVCVRVRKFNFK